MPPERESHRADGLPPYLSVSQVTTYLGCGRRYRFRYVERREPEEKSADLAFGSAVHSAIEWWQGERIAGRSPEEESALRIFRSDWTAQNATGDLVYDDGDTVDLMRELGEALVTLFVARFTGETTPEAVELRFEVPLRDPRTGENLPVPLVGYFDAVSEGVVHEMKTTARKSQPSQWLMQLSAYSYARTTTLGVRPPMRVIQLVKSNAPKIEVDEITLTTRDEAWFLEVAAEVYEAIEKRSFPPNPSWMCPRCEYRRACRRAA